MNQGYKRKTAAGMAAVTMAAAVGPGVAFAQQAKPTEKLMTDCERGQLNNGSLVSSSSAMNCYRGGFIKLIETASRDADAQTRTRAFMHKLHETMRSPAEETRIIVAPEGGHKNNDLLVIVGVVPSKRTETQPVTFCAQQFGKTIVAGRITHKGELLPADVIPNPAGSTRPACNATIMAAKAELDAEAARVR
jgi:hypothetical protein